jgi:hypothetical protein
MVALDVAAWIEVGSSGITIKLAISAASKAKNLGFFNDAQRYVRRMNCSPLWE